jgi:menaquinone-dependent protoporphyrinogen oxidase
MRCGLPAAWSSERRDAVAGTCSDDEAIMSELPTLLIAYASSHGSTRDVADAIAIRLRLRGWDAALLPAADVTELSGYAGVVLGAALYMGRPHRDARRLLKRHHAQLARMPLAVFAMGPLKDTEHDMAGARAQLDRALAHHRDITPTLVEIFGGVVDPSSLRFPFNRMPGGDARDWAAIEAFADRISEAFEAASPLGEPV